MRIRRLGSVVVLALVLGSVCAPTASAAAPQAERLTYRSRAGQRDYLLYVPPHSSPVPLVVYLHGCGAPPSVPGLNEMAQRRGFAVASPIQSRAADANGCWNWADPAHQQRGAGEPAIIAGITRQIIASGAVDPARVFLTGHSAGSGMTANVVAAYPDLFAAAGIIAGCGQNACLDVTGQSAFARMGRFARAVPAYILWGTADETNPYATGLLQALQWATMNDWADDGALNLSTARALRSLSFHPAEGSQPPFVRTGLSSRCGDVELTSVLGMGHVPDARWPVAFPDMVDFLLLHPRQRGC